MVSKIKQVHNIKLSPTYNHSRCQTLLIRLDLRALHDIKKV